VLNASEVIKVIRPPFPYVFPAMSPNEKNVYVYGAGWNDDIPEPLDDEGTHILLIHKLVIKDEKFDGIPAQELFKEPFDLIVSGDNHKGFAYSDGKRHLVNCGSLMRANIDQSTHQPYIYIYDTEMNKMKGHAIPVQDFEEVMDMAKASEEKKRNKTLESFVEGLDFEGKIEGLNFKKNMIEWLKKNTKDVKEGIVTFINEVME